MTDSKNNKDTFLDAMKGATPIKKTYKNYKPIPQIKINQTKKNKKKLEASPGAPKEQNIYEKKTSHSNLKIEKSSINKKLKRGLINIDKTVDLHGSSLEEAKLKFFETVETCFSENKRCILFITGKGTRRKQYSPKESRLFYGKIRTEFMHWTLEAGVNQKILNIEQAGISHGGDGAFLIYLRKNKN